MPLQLQPFFIRYPQFNTEEIDPKQVDFFMADAMVEISQKRWGKLYERGVMALTAHLLALHLRSQESGDNPHRLIASESAGELSVGYVAPTVVNHSDEFYQTTAYGQEYLRLRKLVGVGVMIG